MRQERGRRDGGWPRHAVARILSCDGTLASRYPRRQSTSKPTSNSQKCVRKPPPHGGHPLLHASHPPSLLLPRHPNSRCLPVPLPRYSICDPAQPRGCPDPTSLSAKTNSESRCRGNRLEQALLCAICDESRIPVQCAHGMESDRGDWESCAGWTLLPSFKGGVKLIQASENDALPLTLGSQRNKRL